MKLKEIFDREAFSEYNDEMLKILYESAKDLGENMRKIDNDLDNDRFPENIGDPFEGIFGTPGRDEKTGDRIGVFYPYKPQIEESNIEDTDFSFELGTPYYSSPSSPIFKISFLGKKLLNQSLIQLDYNKIINLGEKVFQYLSFQAKNLDFVYFRFICYCVSMY